MTNLNYSIWLQTALGAGAKLSEIYKVFSSAEEIYRSTERELMLSGVLREKQIQRLMTTDIEETYAVLRDCAAMGIDVVTTDSALYPRQLFELSNFPEVLYVQGDISCLWRKLPFAIVGTRKPCEPGSVYATQALAGALSLSGFTIVSGGALGIDTAAHTAAIVSAGETAAILGCGIGARYLSENEALRSAVAKHGALISEYPPKTEPGRGSFPTRNRLIAALSVGVAVMEGGKKSGSLITAKYAYDMGRDVFVLPSAAPTVSNLGVSELMRDGAKPIYCAMDVFSEYLNIYPEKVIISESIDLFRDIKLQISEFSTPFENTVDLKDVKKRKLADSLSSDAKKVYNSFGTEPLSINDIAEAVFMPTNSVLGALTELEIFGYIEFLPDAKYILK